MDNMEKCIQYLKHIKKLKTEVINYIFFLEKESGENILFIKHKQDLKLLKEFSYLLDRLENIFQTIVKFNLTQICTTLRQNIKIDEENINNIKIDGFLKIISTYEDYLQLKESWKDERVFYELFYVTNKPIIIKQEGYALREISNGGLEIDYINYAEVILIKETLKN